MIKLTTFDLIWMAVFILGLAGTSAALRLGVGKRLLIGAIRTTVQLLAIGFVLKTLFQHAQFGWVSLAAIFMLLMAGREVNSRQKRTFRGWWGYGLGTLAMFISSFSVTLFTLLVIINNQPWYEPQYAIPLLGMLLGNTMNGVSLGLDRLTQSVWEQRSSIEGHLLLGATPQTVMRPILRDSMHVGLIPIINSMAAAGIVSLPGMMTGQILAGAAPIEAVKYQILIMFGIAAGTGFATILAVSLSSRRLFDDRQRLRLDRLHTK